MTTSNEIMKWASPAEAVKIRLGKDFPWWSWHQGQQRDNIVACKHKYTKNHRPLRDLIISVDSTPNLPCHIYCLPQEHKNHQMWTLTVFVHAISLLFLTYCEQNSLCEFMDYALICIIPLYLPKTGTYIFFSNLTPDRKSDQSVCLTHSAAWCIVEIWEVHT